MCPLKGLGDSSTTGKSESLLGDLDDIFAASSASSGSVSSIQLYVYFFFSKNYLQFVNVSVSVKN